jgi:hypothetical protein
MRIVVAVCGLALTGCVPAYLAPGPAAALVFLTREECVSADRMSASLNEALRVLGRRAEYVLVNFDALPPSHPWRGYGTPTILVDNRDLFGQPGTTSSETAPT